MDSEIIKPSRQSEEAINSLRMLRSREPNLSLRFASIDSASLQVDTRLMSN